MTSISAFLVFKEIFHSFNIIISINCRFFIDIADIHYRLHRQKKEVIKILSLFILHGESTCIVKAFNMLTAALKHLKPVNSILVSHFRSPMKALDFFFNRFKVLDLKLKINGLKVSYRIH